MIPFGDWILIERDKPVALAGGIEMPELAEPTHASGVVKKSSEKTLNSNPTEALKIDTRIVFELYAAVKIDIPGVGEGLFIKPENIIAVI